MHAATGRVIEVAMTSQFQSAGRTEIGKVRRRNEDAILVRDDAGLWAVADGLGGHAAGDYASGLIVERLAQVPRADSTFDFIEAIEAALTDVNADLQRAAHTRGVDLIASTVVLLVHARDFVLCGWVGDSRAYCCEGGQCIQLTRDHVFVPAGGAAPPPGGGVLTHAVGAEAAFGVDWAVTGNRRGRTFLLCSDGLNKEMTDAEIAAACRRTNPAAMLDALFDTALERAARDNISAVLVQMQDGTPPRADVDETNRALHALDETRHLGHISHADYRARRRRLFDGPPMAVAKTSVTATGWLASLRRWFGRR